MIKRKTVALEFSDDELISLLKEKCADLRDIDGEFNINIVYKPKHYPFEETRASGDFQNPGRLEITITL